MDGLVLHIVRDSGLTFLPGSIDIKSFSHDVITKTVSFALHLYASRDFHETQRSNQYFRNLFYHHFGHY